MLKVQSGNVRVEVSDELERVIRQAINNAIPWLIPAVEAEVEDIIKEAENLWPIGSRTGQKAYKARRGIPHSKDLFSSYTVVDLDGSIRGVITNDANYWLYIKGSPATEYIRKPLRTRARKLGEELANELRRKMAGG